MHPHLPLKELCARYSRSVDRWLHARSPPAHRLLTRLPEGISTSRAQAVEVFTDLIAEVRRYGEGMIIADQIPSKLAPEVLKNTTTKIIHTLYARDDREVIGDTMGLDDEQRRWLACLGWGRRSALATCPPDARA